MELPVETVTPQKSLNRSKRWNTQENARPLEAVRPLGDPLSRIQAPACCQEVVKERRGRSWEKAEEASGGIMIVRNQMVVRVANAPKKGKGPKLSKTLKEGYLLTRTQEPAISDLKDDHHYHYICIRYQVSRRTIRIEI